MPLEISTVHIEVPITVEERDNYFAARLEGFGAFGYGDTEPSALSDAIEALEFIVETFKMNHSFEDFRRYLDKRRVSHRVEYTEGESPVGREERRRIDREVIFASD